MEIQKNFFEVLKTKLPLHFRLADELSDLLGIGTDSAYRRIRGEKELSISELSVLCKHFDISMDAILNYQSDNIIFKKTHHHNNDIEEYYEYVKSIAEKIEKMATSRYNEMYYLADGIPLFHFMPYPELVLFKVYAWHNMGANGHMSYDEYVQTIDKELLMGYCRRMSLNYEKISSKEIWAKDAVYTTLYLLEYYYDINKFKSNDTCVLMCNQLLEIIDKVEQWTETGVKADNHNAPYAMYFSRIQPENSFMISKWENNITATINIFVNKGITTSDEWFCLEAERWINSIVDKSLNFSGSAKRERFLFFQSIRVKVTELKKKFEN